MSETAQAVRSMTGFAHLREQLPEGELVVSVRSVNHRGLDIRVYLGPELEPWENRLRKLVAQYVIRGHVELRIHFRRHPEAAVPVLNRAMLEAYMRAFEQARQAYGLTGEIDLNQALRYPGVLAPPVDEEPSESFFQQLETVARRALELLNSFREREGRELAQEIRQHLARLQDHVGRMEQLRAEVTPKFRQQLQARLEEWLGSAGIDPQRLIQEAAILAERSDIQEELARLRVHAAELDQMLARGGEIGKRASFLLQEMQRETQTILAKSGNTGQAGLEITGAALEAKAAIEKMHEQVMNLE